MEKIEPTETELAKLKAASEAMSNIDNSIRQLQAKKQQYMEQQKQVKQDIEERTNCPEVPFEQWDISGIDWINYRGKILIQNKGDE